MNEGGIDIFFIFQELLKKTRGEHDVYRQTRWVKGAGLGRVIEWVV
jgi:hypothetical protein